jgi:hypothetical protein
MNFFHFKSHITESVKSSLEYYSIPIDKENFRVALGTSRLDESRDLFFQFWNVHIILDKLTQNFEDVVSTVIKGLYEIPMSDVMTVDLSVDSYEKCRFSVVIRYVVEMK